MMAKDPNLIRRPVVVAGGRVVLGFDGRIQNPSEGLFTRIVNPIIDIHIHIPPMEMFQAARAETHSARAEGF